MHHCSTKHPKINMRIVSKVSLIAAFFVVLGVSAHAQRATTSSPYSRYGLGEIRGDNLPQTRAMGGIASGVRYLQGYGNINISNPASYSALMLTTIDVGVFGNINQLSKNDYSENAYNFALSHINFGIPLGRPGGISFGILPFSDVGSRYSIPGTIDTTNINTVYAGTGGTTKAYLGYGIQLNKNFSVGVNAAYIFGTLNDVSSIEFPDEVGALNIRRDNSRYVNGFSYDYGIQYFQPLANDFSLTVGYSGTAGTKLQTKVSEVITGTSTSVADDEENLPLDTISAIDGERYKIKMPLKHSIGFTLAKNNKWMVGGDFNYAKWSDYREGSNNPGFTDSYGFAIGGQFTPDVSSINYLSLIDYRIGFKGSKSYLHLQNQDIREMALTVGFGFPLASLFGGTFYKVNFSSEFGQRGTLSNSLVRERYINFNLGFTLNDRWFVRRSYD